MAERFIQTGQVPAGEMAIDMSGFKIGAKDVFKAAAAFPVEHPVITSGAVLLGLAAAGADTTPALALQELAGEAEGFTVRGAVDYVKANANWIIPSGAAFSGLVDTGYRAWKSGVTGAKDFMRKFAVSTVIEGSEMAAMLLAADSYVDATFGMQVVAAPAIALGTLYAVLPDVWAEPVKDWGVDLLLESVAGISERSASRTLVE